jgi:hypothetical protein
MKKLTFLISVALVSTILFNSCGSKNGAENGDDKKVAGRKIDPKLDSLITAMAACEQQNTNCEGYNKASVGIQAMSKDAANKTLAEDLFNAISQSTNNKRSAACAHAINFWLGSSAHLENAAYGKVILDALKKEKFDQSSYVGSTLGQLLAGWLSSNDEALLKELHAAVANKSTESRGRLELIRLSGDKSFEKNGYLDVLINIAKDAAEDEAVKRQVLAVIWRVKDAAHIQKVEDLYISLLDNESAVVSGAAMEGLGYMKSAKGFAKVLESVEKKGADEKYASSTARALTNYLTGDAKEGIDKEKALALAIKMSGNKTLKAYSRSAYVYSIESYGGAKAKAALTKLAASSEKEIADPAKQALTRIKK